MQWPAGSPSPPHLEQGLPATLKKKADPVLGEGNRACLLSGISPAQVHFAIVPGDSIAVPSAQ